MKKIKKIGIFAPSSPVFGEKNDETYSYLESKGYEVHEHPQVRQSKAHMAGGVNERVNAIHDLYQDDSIDILMSFWGGQNSNELLPHLDYELIKGANKPMIGYSDTTALLLAITHKTGVINYMGPGGITFTKPQPVDYSYDYFEKAINEDSYEVKDSDVYAGDHFFLNDDPTKRDIKTNDGRKVFKEGKAKGEVIAANLQTLLVLAGTEYMPDLDKKILFLEESEDESVGFVHRYLTHLTQVIEVNKLGGVCFGRFCTQSGFDDDYSVEDLLSHVFSDVKIPIIYDLSFGHSDPIFTIPNGGVCELDTMNNKIVLKRE